MANLTFKQIQARIAASAKNRKAADEYDHVTAVAILVHAQGKGKGDTSLVAALMNALPASTRRTAMRSWFAKYSPVVIEGGKKAGEPFTARLSETYKEMKDIDAKVAAWKVAEGEANPWHKIADKEPEEKEYNLAALIKMVQALGKRIEGKIDEGKVPANDKDNAKILIAKLAEIKVA